MLDRPSRYETPTARHATHCAVEDWLALLGHRWNACLLWHLTQGPLRNRDLMERLEGITPKVLSERIETLTARGLISRRERASFPREVHYLLTEKGARIEAILRQFENVAL